MTKRRNGRGAHLSCERLEPRIALADSPLISEFLASNGSTLLDEDGEASDWIEIHNPAAEGIDLGGWYLTDDAAELTKWELPPLTLEGGGYLVVFASDKDRRPIGMGAPPTGELHANFRLASPGEFLALVEPDGETVADAYAPAFPPQIRDISYGVDSTGLRTFLPTPTPGAANGPGEDPPAQVVINEIMYHPASRLESDEFIELYNAGSRAVSLAGWRFSDGVEFSFGNVSISAGEYLVVAADPAAFAANYPLVTNVVGGWDGQLSNSGERIRLENADGLVVDEVTYADEGDWSIRQRGPEQFGHEGWVWSDAHDGGSGSLELVSPTLPNEFGGNWLASTTGGGTPGWANSVARTDAAPLIVAAAHQPIIPRSSDPVTITVRIFDELPAGIAASVHYRMDGEPEFTILAMRDDGQGGDAGAGDDVYTAVLPAHADGTVIEFYVAARDAAGHTRTAPGPAQPTGEQLTNYLYQVDDTFEPAAEWSPRDTPVYRLIMTDAERAELAQIGSNSREGRSRARMNGTFVTVDAEGVQFRYEVGVRNRGQSSRARRPNSYHVDIPTDRPWNGIREFNLNTQFTHLQLLGMRAYQRAGLPAEDTQAVRLLVNGADLSSEGAPSFGVYVYVEAGNSDFAANHFPGDDAGNLYRVFRNPVRNLPHGDLRVLDDEADYRIYYDKKTNSAAGDYSDLLQLVDVLNNAPDVSYLEEVRQVVDIEQWLAYFAVNAILNNQETNLSTGVGDDYFLYSGVNDPRFVLIPHDFDSILGQGVTLGEPTGGIYRAATNPVIERFLFHPEILRRYHETLLRLLETTFAKHMFHALADELLGSLMPPDVVSDLKSFLDARRQHILQQIAGPLTVASALPQLGGYHVTAQSSAALSGTAPLAGTRSVLVNGFPAEYDPATGGWSIGEGIAGVPLRLGVNRLLVEAFAGPAGTGRVLETTSIDVWRDGGSMQAVSGEIDGDTVWTAAAGPYHVTGSLRVTSGATLSIGPGTTVFFDPETGLTSAGGRILAEGTAHARIRFAGVPLGGRKWNGLTLVDSPLESRFRYVDFEGGDARGAATTLDHARALFEHVSWFGVDEVVLDARHPILVVRNSVFPAVGGDETVHLSGLDPGEQFVFEGNTFGFNSSGNDVVDVGHSTLNPPTIYFRDNLFLGGLDDGLDVDGFPTVIEGNTFRNFHLGTSRTTTSNAISTGHATVDGEVVSSQLTLRNNTFYNVDHALLLKDGSFAELTNNTIVGATIAAIQFNEVGGTAVAGPGRGATVDGVLFWGIADLFEHVTPQTELLVQRSLSPADVSEFGAGNLMADPQFVDPAAGDFRLSLNSPAIAAGPGGTDIGAVQVERADTLRVSELHYHPHEPQPGSGELDVDADQFEFLELVNTSATAVLNLSGVRFTAGIEFDFTTSPVQRLAPGERVVLVRNGAAFESRYGSGHNIASEFTGGTALSNGGETVRVENAIGGTVIGFTYSDGGAWPAAADGNGRSLVVVSTEGDYNSAANWQASTRLGGTPGTGEPTGGRLAGDYNGNGLVEQTDLDFILVDWGRDAGLPPPGWINDLPVGTIDQSELDAVLVNWGRTTSAAVRAAEAEPLALGRNAAVVSDGFLEGNGKEARKRTNLAGPDRVRALDSVLGELASQPSHRAGRSVAVVK